MTSKRPAPKVDDEPVDKKQKTTNLGAFHRGKTTNPETIEKLRRAQQSPKATCWDASKHSQWTIDIGEDIWREYVAGMLTAKELAISSRVSSFTRILWQGFLKKNHVRVPGDAPSLREGLALCGVLSTMKTYSEAEPLTLMLGPGEHAIDDTWAELDAYGCKSATRQTTLATNLASGEVDEEEFIPPDVLLLQREEEREKWNEHLSLQGCGIDITVVRGGLVVLQGMKIKGITFANAHGHGLWVENASSIVEVEECSFSDCEKNGVMVMYHGSLFATRCIFARNRVSGAFIQCELGVFTDCIFQDNVTGITVCDGDGFTCDVHLVGSRTDIHGNKTGLNLYGRTLIAGFHTSTVYVHLPTSHNTFHNNKVQNVHLSLETPVTSFQNVPAADSTISLPNPSARRYRHSKVERNDVLDYYTKRAGDIRNILASIPHSRENDGPRFIEIIFRAIKDKAVEKLAANPSMPQIFHFKGKELGKHWYIVNFRKVWERYLTVSAVLPDEMATKSAGALYCSDSSDSSDSSSD